MQLALLGSVLIFGLLGSWHCGVMCGPLCCNLKKNIWGYHLGRLFSYSAIGLMLNAGNNYLFSIESQLTRLTLSVFMILVLIFMLIRQMEWMRIQPKSQISRVLIAFQIRLLRFLRPISEKSSFFMGVLTGILPCGWLYSFLILASQLKEISAVISVILVFWLTSLPVFFLINGFLKKLIQKSSIRHQQIAGIVLVIAGILTVMGHWVETIH